MMSIRPSSERGITRLPWLDGKHTFSFGEYFDPAHHHFRALRVINEDVVSPGKGFDTHPHRDMEIITVVLDGAIEHRDNTGSGGEGGHGIINPGEVQVMSAGTGVYHSEHNASKTEPVHLLQIWLVPEHKGATPRYDQKSFERPLNRPTLIASQTGRAGSLTIGQDAELWRVRLDANGAATVSLAQGRHAWVQVAAGELSVNGTRLAAGDGAAISDVQRLELASHAADTDVLVFDLA